MSPYLAIAIRSEQLRAFLLRMPMARLSGRLGGRLGVVLGGSLLFWGKKRRRRSLIVLCSHSLKSNRGLDGRRLERPDCEICMDNHELRTKNYELLRLIA